MGAWGIDSFENDDALDWVAELEAEGVQAAGGAIADVLALEGDYLEAPLASRALAAAELIATLNGRPGKGLPPEISAFAAQHRGLTSLELSANARRAVERVSADSELRDLWAESEDYDAWVATVADLRSRLS